jgi:hypothetical protein
MAKAPAKPPPPGPPKAPASKTVISENFKLVFLTIAGFTLVFFVAGVALGLAGEKEMSRTCFTMTTGGFDTIVGLLGGKNL